MKKIVTGFVLLIVFGCAPTVLIPTEADADRAKTKYGSSSLDELLEGKKLYETYCGRCHGLYKPSSQSEEGWKHEVPDMSRKVNKQEGSEILNESKQKLILQYLVTMSTAKNK